MTFIPYEYRIKMPNVGGRTQAAGGGAEQPQIVLDSIIVPLSRTVDLADINGGAVGTPGVVYENDYFLFHPGDLSLQRVWVSTDEDVAQDDEFSIQVIQKNGGETSELSASEGFAVIPSIPETFDLIYGPDEGAIYLRVRSTYQSTLVYVTLELLTTKVP